ncbi:hypothetical protein ABZ235_38760 [Streptomyces canus]|uniref:hypothetical protein n=1 Tax=Streptomyces canus TaxID=58343 RepID=UPI0033B348ED
MRPARNDHSPAAEELRAANHALATDPVNTGQLGTVDLTSPAAQQNLDAQDRVRAAETAYRS